MEPQAKRQKTDGDISRVSAQVLDKAKDIEKWIEERRKNWPTQERTKERKLNQQAAQTDDPTDESNDTRPQDTAGKQKPAGSRPMCRFFLKGTCKAGSSCKFSHERQPQGPRIYKRFEAPVKGSLFKKMVQKDLDTEDEQILDFVCYLRQRGLLG